MTDKKTERCIDEIASAYAYYYFCCAKFNGTYKNDSDYEKLVNVFRDIFRNKMEKKKEDEE